jgi:hypothetical protein
LPASYQKLPRWRGFNLLEKFNCSRERKPYLEEDFRLIAKLGFDFVRLPMDYRCWTAAGHWERFDEAALRDIDQAVAWGGRYGLHILLDFHRAPGYTVAKPSEAKSLWTDAQAQRVCAQHWAMFARRYKGIPNERLSFNLLNEPPQIEPKVYTEVIRRLASAIRAEDPNRLIIADGLSWGTVPVPQLRALHVAEATRGYAPMQLSHYQAKWTGGERFPLPSWPLTVPPPGTLYGPSKKDWAGPMVIEGPFAQPTVLRLHVLTVSNHATLVAQAEGRQLWRQEFVCGPGQGEWKRADYMPQWRIYQNLYDKDYFVAVPSGTQRVALSLSDGDWLRLGALGLQTPGSRENALPLDPVWG